MLSDAGANDFCKVIGDFAATQRIHHAMQRWDDLGAVLPVACYADALAIVTEKRKVVARSFLPISTP